MLNWNISGMCGDDKKFIDWTMITELCEYSKTYLFFCGCGRAMESLVMNAFLKATLCYYPVFDSKIFLLA